MRSIFPFAAAVVVAVGTASLAQTPKAALPQSATVSAATTDPVICEKEADLGTRLASHKICRKRSEWDELRREDRSATEKVQEQRGMAQPGH